MNTIVLSKQSSLINSWINELRNVDIQHDRMRFRRNMERIGEIAALMRKNERPTASATNRNQQ